MMAKTGYKKASPNIKMSTGESLKVLRELQELTQKDLAEITGIAQATISAIERDRVNLGLERAKALARALRVHPAVIAFPGWDILDDDAA
jgi:transcriptional regulator with XRE-family HTH domain